MSGERLYGPTDVADVLGVRPSAVTMWRKRGTGPLPLPAAQRRDVPLWTAAQVETAARTYRAELESRYRESLERARRELARAAAYVDRFERIGRP